MHVKLKREWQRGKVWDPADKNTNEKCITQTQKDKNSYTLCPCFFSVGEKENVSPEALSVLVNKDSSLIKVITPYIHYTRFTFPDRHQGI